MAVTFPDAVSYLASSVDSSSIPMTLSHEVTPGTTLLLVFAGHPANAELSGVSRDGQNLALVEDLDDSTSSGSMTLEVWGIVNPNVGTADIVTAAVGGVVNCKWVAALNVHGTVTDDLASAIQTLTTDLNNSTATNTNVHASGGSAGNKLLFAGNAQGDDMLPVTNNDSFTELLEDNTGGTQGNAGDETAYIAEKDAPSGITVNWNLTDENVGGLFEIVAASESASFVGTPSTTPTTDGYTVNYEITGANDTVSAVAVPKDSAAPSAAQVHAGQNSAGAAALAAASEAATADVPDTLSLTGLDFPIHDVYVAVDTTVVTLADQTKSPPAGYQYVTIAGLPWGVGQESILDGASPAAVDGDIIECSAEVDSFSLGANAHTLVMDDDGTFLIDPGEDASRLSFEARFYDVSVGDWSDDPAVVFYVNNSSPSFVEEDDFFTFLQNVEITPVPLSSRWFDAESDDITVTYEDTLPTGLSIVAGELVGTPTSAAAATDYTERGTDAIGDFSEQEISFTITATGTMPDVDDGDVTEAAAITAIEGEGLQTPTVTTDYSDTVDEGNVISQDPAAGTIQATTDPTSIVVSLGEEPADPDGAEGMTEDEFRRYRKIVASNPRR